MSSKPILMPKDDLPNPFVSGASSRLSSILALQQTPTAPGGAPLMKKRKLTRVACDACRSRRARCDGQRPSCSRCAEKSIDCAYSAAPGESSMGALKRKHAELERAFHEVQHKLKPPSATQQVDDSSAETLRTRQNGEDHTIGSSHLSSTTIEDWLPTRSPVDQMRDTAPVQMNQPGGSDNSENTKVEQSARRSSRSVVIQLKLPDQEIAKQAIKAFFSSSGKLFHIYSFEQTTKHYLAVYDEASEISAANAVAIGAFSSVAALGLQYTGDPEMEVFQNEFYGIAKHQIETVIESSALEAVKVCALHAIYNVMSKATVAFSYIDLGLSLARRHGLDKPIRPRLTNEDTWIDLRKAWRTLMFMSSWLSVTLGHLSGYDIFSAPVPLKDMEIDSSTRIGDIAQTEMSKIAVLKANILRTHLAFKHLTIRTIETILEEFRSWYRQLPPETQLANLFCGDLPDEVRRTIYHVHLLYLGGIMLLYRRVVSQFLLSNVGDGRLGALLEPVDKIYGVAGESVEAAMLSARILRLLLAEKSIFKRCWLIIFQAWTSCTVLLHAVAQKRMHGFTLSSYEVELDRVQDCLEVLEYCGTADPVARRFHHLMTDLRLSILKTPHGSRSKKCQPTKCGEDTDLSTSSAFLLNFPQEGDPESISLSTTLLNMLCSPFGDSNAQQGALDAMQSSWKTDPTRLGYAQMVERLDWQLESSIPFHWNMSKIPAGSAGAEVVKNEPPNRFLESITPSGWATAAEAMQELS